MKKFRNVVFIVIVAYIFALLFAPKYISNGLKYWFSNVDDYKKFTNNTIHKSTHPKVWEQATNYNKMQLNEEDKDFFKERKTCAYLVIQNNKIVYEIYDEGYDNNTITASFSVAKTVNALLIGKLLEEGKIKSLEEDVKTYVPELTNIPDGKLRIKDVLTMSGSIDWKESYWNMFSLTAESYYGEDLDKLMGKLHLKNNEKPGTIWEYQSCCTQILGYIIKKASGMSITQYTNEVLWQPLGMQHDALWSTDKDNGIEKSFCCINATARDFARLGNLILNEGKVDTVQLINSQWIHDMVQPAKYLKSFDGRICDWYGYQTWIIHHDNMQIPYFRGVHGQLIFVVKEKNAVIVRLGKKIVKKNVDAHEQNDDIKNYLRIGLKLLD